MARSARAGAPLRVGTAPGHTHPMCQPTGQAFWPWPGWAMTQKNRIWNLFLVHLAGFADIRAKPIRTFSVHPLLLSPFYMPSPDPKAPSGAIPQTFTVVRANREQLAGHRGRVVWFTGFSGAGKSTLANALEVELHKAHKRTYVLDGDNVRRGLCKDLGFSDADRMENMRRVAEVARLFVDAGVVVLVAFISPSGPNARLRENCLQPGTSSRSLWMCRSRWPSSVTPKACTKRRAAVLCRASRALIRPMNHRLQRTWSCAQTCCRSRPVLPGYWLFWRPINNLAFQRRACRSLINLIGLIGLNLLRCPWHEHAFAS